MRSIFRAHLLGLTALLACGGERRDAPPPPSPPVPSSQPTATPTQTSSPPTASSAAPPSPPPSTIFRRTRSFTAGGGWEAAAAFAALRPVLPEIDGCYGSLLSRDAKATGMLRIELRQTQRAEVRATGIGDDAFRDCAKGAAEKIALPPVTSKGGTPTMVLEVDLFPSSSAAPPLPSARKTEKITIAPDGTCVAVEKADCPPNKICSAPEKHPVACPDAGAP